MDLGLRDVYRLQLIFIVKRVSVVLRTGTATVLNNMDFRRNPMTVKTTLPLSVAVE